ncbi:MAG: DUF881 domain-containing protein [Desulfitobacteriaceae bacterium]|nr:DUF881 domain-containing protein [Desulfitobacteriaceae bacterium]MDD4752121.1 DUF881 domain-containing protein [Desulfitobacteriaceae bacterium]
MLNWKKHIPLTIACVLTGLLLTVALKTQTALNSENVNKNQTLIDLIENLEMDTQTLEESIGSVQKQIDEVQKQGTSGQGMVAGLQNQVEELKLRAGQTDVFGPGVTIVLEDNTAGAEMVKKNNPELYNPEDFIVHDKSLLYLVSALRGQAEAIGINNQRLVASSDIRCVGTVIMVNSTRLAPPYEIQVIGNPKILEATVLNSDEYFFLQSKEMPVTITQQEEISLPALKGSNTANYANPVKEGEQ